MTSSTSYELTLALPGGGSCVAQAGLLDPSAREVASDELRADLPLHLVVKRPSGLSTYGQLRLGDEVLGTLQPGATELRIRRDPLRDEYGEITFLYEEHEDDEDAVPRPVLEITAMLRCRPEVEALYDRLIEELEQAHAGLAEDVLGRTGHRLGRAAGRAGAIRPEQELEALEGLAGRLAGAVERIGLQPSSVLVREVRLQRWRPGDRVRSGGLTAIAASPETRHERGRVVAVGKVRTERSLLTTDIGEHRHIRQGLARLGMRAKALVSHCGRAVERFEVERIRWGRSREPDTSVFAARYAPRIQALQGWARRAHAVRERVERLLDDHPFVSEAGPVRTPLARTPIFASRRGYKEAYAALREIQRMSATLVEGDEIRVRFRRLSTLYEYWCFVRVVGLVRDMPGMGKPEPTPRFRVVDEVYRPDLAPGQSFAFPWTQGRTVRVTYEPDIHPLGRDVPTAGPYRAALTRGVLRPDVTIEVTGADRAPMMLVIDAKSIANFTVDDLWAPTDYRSRICDPRTGHQPVRQVWLLHRDAAARLLVNIPGYLDQQVGDLGSSVLGGVAFLPERTDAARRVLERFLALCGA